VRFTRRTILQRTVRDAGKYQVKLSIRRRQSYTSTLEIKPDPRLNVSQADLEKQFTLETESPRS